MSAATPAPALAPATSLLGEAVLVFMLGVVGGWYVVLASPGRAASAAVKAIFNAAEPDRSGNLPSLVLLCTEVVAPTFLVGGGVGG